MTRVAERSSRGPGGRIFRYSAFDLIPAVLVYIHLALIFAFFVLWPSLSWPSRIVFAFVYALAIGWNLDSLSHNFIHNPFFRSKFLNRLTEFVLTFELGTPQTMYGFIHMKHHAGNSDRPGPSGETIDPISIYRYGRDGKAEPMLSYVFLQFWRDDGPFEVARQIHAKRPWEARKALQEFWAMIVLYGAMAAIHWQFVLLLAPFYYLGQSFSMLIAYYEHLGADPLSPAAMGVSTYSRPYNFLFLNNGYHAEHHHQPKGHWTVMEELRRHTRDQQIAAGTRVIRYSHPLGFLEPSSWQIPTARNVHSSKTRAS